MNGYSVLDGETTSTLANPHMAEPYQPLTPNVQPTFRLSGPFSGAEGISASTWLKKLQYDLKPYYQLGSSAYAFEYIEAIDVLWTEEAAEWAEGNSLMQARITKLSPTSDDVEAIKQLMQDSFPQRSSEVHTFDIKTEFENLRPRSDETLSAYYKRARSMMERMGARDRPETGIPLLPLESAFLDNATRPSVKGISDSDVKKEAARGLSSSARSFYSVYSIAEKARKAKAEVNKLAYTEANEVYSKQVDFLWGVIRGTSLPSGEKDIAYEILCDLSGSKQVDYLWDVIRDTNLHTEVKELVYNTLWDMGNWSIQSTPLGSTVYCSINFTNPVCSTGSISAYSTNFTRPGYFADPSTTYKVCSVC